MVALGIEDSSEGCQGSNPTCNEAQLRADNVINGAEPQLMIPAGGDFRPAVSSNLFGIGTVSTTAFAGGDRVSTPLAPVGILTNTVSVDRSGTERGESSIVGAYDTSDVSSDDPSAPENPDNPGDPEEPTVDEVPSIQSVRCSPSSVRRGGKVRCIVSASDDRGIRNVVVQIGRLPKKGLRRTRGRYEGIVSTSRLAVGRHRITASISDTGGHRVSRAGGVLRVRK